MTSEKIINPKRTELKLPNKIKEAKTFNSQSDKISRLDNKSKLSESNNFQRIILSLPKLIWTKNTYQNYQKLHQCQLDKIHGYKLKHTRVLQEIDLHTLEVSLSRALAIRTELIQFGVNSTNIDVRALGEVNDGNQTDRVDVSIMPQ